MTYVRATSEIIPELVRIALRFFIAYALEPTVAPEKETRAVATTLYSVANHSFEENGVPQFAALTILLKDDVFNVFVDPVSFAAVGRHLRHEDQAAVAGGGVQRGADLFFGLYLDQVSRLDIERRPC